MPEVAPQEPPDDPSIANETELWRRIPPDQIVRDGHGAPRPSTGAFRDSTGGHMSVLLREAGMTIERALGGREGFGIVSFSAGFARSLSQKVIRSPEPEEPLHGEVVGKKTDSVKKQLVRNSHWIHSPPHALS